MRFRLRTLLIVVAIGPAILAGGVLIAMALLGFEPTEHPPPPLVPSTENERLVLGMATSFVRAKGAVDYAVPVKIEPWPHQQGCFLVEFWTPRREVRGLGMRAVIVNVTSNSAEFVGRL